MTNRIPLTQGQHGLVDESDYAWLSCWRWRNASNGHALRSSTDPQGKQRFIQMHRTIMQA